MLLKRTAAGLPNLKSETLEDLLQAAKVSSQDIPTATVSELPWK